MDIHQHNYLEIFLLYADGELTHSEMNEVDKYVESNPNLVAEFEEILNLKILPEETPFLQKEWLFKGAQISISENNQETYFMLYHDGELDPTEKLATETYLLANPSAQHCFDQFAKTILPVEQHPFPEKSKLYRSPAKKIGGSVFGLQKLAIAASILGICLFSYFLWEPPLLKPISPQMTPLVSEKSSAPKDIPTQKMASIELVPGPKLPIKIVNKERDLANHQSAATEMQATKIPEEIVNPEKLIAQNAPTSFVAEEASLPVNSHLTEGIAIDNDLSANLKSFDSAENYTLLDTDEEDRTLIIGNIELNKDKFRGLFRKAGSIFRNKKNTEK